MARDGRQCFQMHRDCGELFIHECQRAFYLFLVHVSLLVSVPSPL